MIHDGSNKSGILYCHSSSVKGKIPALFSKSIPALVCRLTMMPKPRLPFPVTGLKHSFSPLGDSLLAAFTKVDFSLTTSNAGTGNDNFCANDAKNPLLFAVFNASAFDKINCIPKEQIASSCLAKTSNSLVVIGKMTSTDSNEQTERRRPCIHLHYRTAASIQIHLPMIFHRDSADSHLQ